MAFRSRAASRPRRAGTRLARRYWLPVLLLMIALLAGAAAWIAFDRGTTAPDEPPVGAIDLATDLPVSGEKPQPFLNLSVGYSSGLPNDSTVVVDPAAVISPGDDLSSFSAPVAALVNARYQSVLLWGRGTAPGARIRWSLQFAGSARMFGITVTPNDIDVWPLLPDEVQMEALGLPKAPGSARLVNVNDLGLPICNRCQVIRGVSFANSAGFFAAGIIGKVQKPLATHGAGLTYVHLPAIQGGAEQGDVTSPISAFQRPKNLTASVNAGTLEAGDAVTSIYPEGGLRPAAPKYYGTDFPENRPGLAIIWEGKSFPALRAEITNRAEQRQASALVFTAGGLLGFAAGVLLEAILKFREPAPSTPSTSESAPTTRSAAERHRRLVAMYRGRRRTRR
jgi:hypothetical protein